MVAGLDDKAVYYAPMRSIKSAKTFFSASESLDDVPVQNAGFDRVLGHPLELVPQHNPVTPMAPGTRLEVQLLFEGEPLADTRVSFIPRGVELEGEFDERYERRTDEQEGLARFTPEQGNVYLVVAHHEDAEASGEDYESTKHSATLVVYVSAVPPADQQEDQ